MTKRPESCTSLTINLVGLAGFFLAFYLLFVFQAEFSLSLKIVVILIAAAIPIIVLELIFKRSPIWNNILESKSRLGNLARSAIKLLGLYTVFIAVVFVYWLFPEYQGDFYDPFWNLLYPAIPWLIILSIPYVSVIQHLYQE